MGNTAQNKGEGNGMSPEKIRELIDKGSGDADLNQIVFEELLDEQAQEFADAKSIKVDELTDDELAEMKKNEAETNQHLKRKARYDKARHSLRFGMKLKINDPESKLFKTAEELLDILDRCETDRSSVSQLELRRYKTGFSKYDALLDAEIQKLSETKSPEKGGINQLLESVPSKKKDTKEHGKDAKYEVLWDDENELYVPLTKALNLANDDSMTLTTMSRKLKNDMEFPIHRMHNGRRCKVHFGDWEKWLKYSKGKITDEAIERYLMGVEQRKKDAHQAKLLKKRVGKCRVM